jgi:uncharacterized protein (TIGR03435 family)
MQLGAIVLALASTAAAQTFDIVSVKRSVKPVGKDYQGKVMFSRGQVTAANVSMKTLIASAYRVQLFQITGGPTWLDQEEYDVDTRAAAGSTTDQLRAMLQTMLAERFHLALHREKKEMRAYALRVDKGGIKVATIEEDSARAAFPYPLTRATMLQLANVISIQLTIPNQLNTDPNRPSIATGAPVAVIDKTGLDGTYDLKTLTHHEPGTDPFTSWQRRLREDLGLRLDAEKDPVEVLVIDRVDRMPTAN